MALINLPEVYTRRPSPPDTIKAWLDVEFANIQRAIPYLGILITKPAGEVSVAIGPGALGHFVGSSGGSVAVGNLALASDTTGDENVAVGSRALASVTTGSGNTAVGNLALTHATGSVNTAVGDGALMSLTTGIWNTALGASAGGQMTTGSYNTAVGVNALRSEHAGSANVALGESAMMEVAGGVTNTAVGTESLWGNISGQQIVDGSFATPGLPFWTLGTGWTAGVGMASKSADGTGTLAPTQSPANSGVRYIDYGVGATYLISYTVTGLTVGAVTVSFGGVSDTQRTANGAYTFAVQPTSFPVNLAFTPTGGSANISRFSITGVSFVGTMNKNIEGNTALGNGALYMTCVDTPSTGQNNVAVGLGAARQHTIGNDCVYIGVESGVQNGSGNGNTAIGRFSLYSGNSQSDCVALGYGAGFYETQSNKLFIDNALRANEADGRAKALVYGVFDASPANQALTINGQLALSVLQVFADNAAATGGGLTANQLYRTAAGVLMVVF